jgi:hypothetical protein
MATRWTLPREHDGLVTAPVVFMAKYVQADDFAERAANVMSRQAPRQEPGSDGGMAGAFALAQQPPALDVSRAEA